MIWLHKFLFDRYNNNNNNNNNTNNNSNDLLQSIQQSEVLHLQYLHSKSTLKEKNIHINKK